jgi:hypothetical protein
MKTEIIKEGLFENDLMGLIIPLMSLYEYEPKIEEDAIVIAFYVKEANAAEDLSVFIEKSSIDGILDCEVSSAPDEDGDYLVFVEFSKNVKSSSVMSVLKIINHLCDVKNWKFEAFKLPKTYDLTEKAIDLYLNSIQSGKLD